MDRTKLGLLGAISSLVALPIGASAAVSSEPAVPAAQSFSDLLQPIPGAVEKLKVSDAQELAKARGVQLIQTRWHHHHAHYYRRWRPYYGGYAYVPYYGGGYYHHHHHNHHHWR